MGKIYNKIFSVLILMFFAFYAKAQQPNCQNAIPFCTGQTVSYPASTGGTSNPNPQGLTNTGCVCSNGLVNPNWYYLQIAPNSPPGQNLVIDINGGSTAQDVDFIAYGPFTTPTGACTAGLSGTCSSNCSTSLPQNCSGGIESCSYSTSSHEIANFVGTQPGEYYLLVITNFADIAGNISFSQTGGAASTDCSIRCDFNTPNNMCPTSSSITLNNYITGVNVVTNGTWSTAPLSGGAATGLGTGAAATFNPASYTTDQIITYAVTGGSCKDTIYMSSASNASWSPPANVCANGSTVNLTSLVSGTAGGTWSGTGVSGTTFNPSGLSGNQLVTYSVGPAGCQATSAQNIPVIADVDPSWSPQAICTSAGAVNLNTWLTGTSGGTWSGTGVSGTNFDPSGGTQSVTYTVGTSPCQETSTQTITVTPSTSAAWTPPAALCASSGLLNLNTLITGTTGGTWSGTGVSGTNFDPTGQSGPIAITYTVGTAPCTATSTQNITVNPATSAAWTSPGSLCVNSGVVNLNTYITGTSGGTWSGTGVTGNSFDPTGLAGTSPSITYTTGSGSCQDIVSHNISVISIADASWTPPAAMCTGSAIIDLSTTVTGTTGGTWSGTGVTSPNFDPTGLSGPQAVTYSVGSGACAATSTQNITVNPSTTPTWTNPGPICANAAPMNLDALVTGSTGGTWSGTGVTGSNFDPAGLGGTSPNVTYTVGTGGCQTTSSQSIVIDLLPVATWTPPASMCSGSPIVDLNSTLGGSSTTGGTWSGTGVTNPNFDPAGLSGPQAVTYTVVNGSCTATSTQNITVNPTTTATWTNPSPVCVAGGSINLDPLITGTTGGTWSGPGVSVNIFDPSALGGTSPSITYTVGVGACQSVSSQVITIDPMANASWTTPGSVCVNSSILDLNTTLGATSTVGGTWSGTGVTSPNFDPAGLSGPQAITYTVGTGACAATSTQNINVLPNVTATWTNFSPVCESSGIVSLNPLITGTTGGTWSGTGVTGNSFDPTGLGSQTISVTYTVGTAPCQDVLAQQVVVTPAPLSLWTAPTGSLCQGNTAVVLDSYLDATSSPGGSWTIDGVTAAGNLFDPSALTVGPHAVVYTAGTAPCQSSTSHNITVAPAAIAAWTAPTFICTAAGVTNLNTLLNSGSTAGGTWSGTGVSGNLFDPTGMVGNTTITYIVGSGSCQDAQSSTIAISPDVNPSWSNATVSNYCANSGALNLNSLLTGTAGGTWSGTGVTGSNFDPTGLTGPIAITYTVGTAPCDETLTQNINVVDAPVVVTTSAIVNHAKCGGNNGSITSITATTPPLVYAWVDISGDTIGTNADLMNIPVGTYTLFVTNANNCTVATSSYSINNNTLINADFSATPGSGAVPLVIQFTDSSSNAVTYGWDFGNEVTSSLASPQNTYYVAGEYNVLLTVVDSLGCVDTASIKIVVTEDFTYAVPNVFSPNDDGANDVFYVKGTGIKDVNCKIYNRWGQFVFEWQGPKGGWDGNTLSGSAAPSGVYYYLMEITDKDDNKLEPMKNYFTLVR